MHRLDGQSNADQDDAKLVSDRTQLLFALLVASGTDLPSLLALVSSAYADGGNHVLDELQARIAPKTSIT